MITLYDQENINRLYNDIDNIFSENLKKASEETNNKLNEFFGVCECNTKKISSRDISGWIFENVVRIGLRQELKNLGYNPDIITPQYTLKYNDSELEKVQKRKIDLKIGDKILVEIKGFGLFYDYNSDKVKYQRIKDEAEKQKFNYLCILKKGEKEPKNKDSIDYRGDAIILFGKENCFFLDDPNEDNWKNFVKRVSEILKQETK